jgi:hypothetical protein
MYNNPSRIDNLELKFQKALGKVTISTMIFLCVAIVDLTLLLLVNIVALKAPLSGVPFEIASNHALVAAKWVMFFFGPITIILVGIGFGAPDIVQGLLPKRFTAEIETTAAMRRAAWFIGYDLAALIVVYLWDFSEIPYLYGLVLIIIGVLFYQAGEWPKTVVKKQDPKPEKKGEK